MDRWRGIRSRLDNFRSSTALIYAVVNLAAFIDAFVYCLIIPVLPFALVEVIHVDADRVQTWIAVLIAAYGLGLIFGGAIAGYYADRASSRRWPYLVGLIALLISTLAFSFGRAMWILVIGRIVQGASSASVYAVGVAILADAVGENGIGFSMGFVTASMAMGMVLGPIAGGLLYHNYGYLAVFDSAYVLIALDVALRLIMVERKREHQESMPEDGRADQSYGTFRAPQPEGRQDAESSGESASTSNAASASTSRASSTPPSTDQDEDALISKPKRTRGPMLDLLLTPRMISALIADGMQSLIWSGLETVLPLRIKTVFHYNSAKVGWLFFLFILPCVPGPLIGLLSDKIGAKIVISTGFGMLVPLLILLRFVDHYEPAQVGLVCVLLLLIGTALNLLLTPAWSDCTYAVEEKAEQASGEARGKAAYSAAFGLMNMSYAVGAVLGPLLGGWLMDKVGWNWLTAGSGILCALCVPFAVIYTGGRRQDKSAAKKNSETAESAEC